MNTDILGVGGTWFLLVYLLLLVGIGWMGRLARRDHSLEDHYLGNRGLGLFVLFLTLYATQYSGNTLIGFAGKAYRDGYFFLVSVTFMMSIIGAYMIYAPKLHRLSHQRGYITIADYIDDRFRVPALTLIVTIICVVAMANYVLSNLKAIGYIVEVSTAGRIGFAEGVIGLALVMVIYETLGGLRSVAWTDVIQGILLLLGCVAIFVGIEIKYGGLTTVAEHFITSRPELWAPPDAEHQRIWLSTLIIVFFGISIYPHAIQRIYAAKNEAALKRAFQIMVWMPLFTTLFMLVVGIVGAAQFPGLDRQHSEQITLLVLADLANHIPYFQVISIVFICAAIAAVMSTVDSALLSISALFVRNIYSPWRPLTPQHRLTSIGKRFSWLLMALMVWLAIDLPQTIWRLIEIKLELLIQIAPAIFLGIQTRWLSGRATLYGIITGLLTTGVLMAAPNMAAKPLGFHAGVWGLLINVLVMLAYSYRYRQRPQAVSS